MAVRIMASEDTHTGIMEFFWRNLGEPSRMLGLKNAGFKSLVTLFWLTIHAYPPGHVTAYRTLILDPIVSSG